MGLSILPLLSPPLGVPDHRVMSAEAGWAKQSRRALVVLTWAVSGRSGGHQLRDGAQVYIQDHKHQVDFNSLPEDLVQVTP